MTETELYWDSMKVADDGYAVMSHVVRYGSDAVYYWNQLNGRAATTIRAIRTQEFAP